MLIPKSTQVIPTSLNVSLKGPDREYCVGTDVTIQLVGSPSGGTYGGIFILYFTFMTNEGSALLPGNQFNPSSLAPGQYSLSYTLVSNSTGCPNIGYA